jgi:hypothetical protein
MFVSVRSVGNTADYTESMISNNGGTYQLMFYGKKSEVTPQYSLYIKNYPAGTTLDLGSRYSVGAGCSPFYTTRSSNLQAASLVNGEAFPPELGTPSKPGFPSYLCPYIDGAGKVKIGPLSILVIFELTDTNHMAAGFNYADSAMLISLSDSYPGGTKPKSNNGNGNNIDGVDSSNPGVGSGGPNGTIDPSGGVDDEIIK